MKKILLISTFAAAIVGCSHGPTPNAPTATTPSASVPSAQPETRQPSQTSKPDLVVKGAVGLSVSKTSAGFDDDAFFFVQVDCNGDRILSDDDQSRIIHIDANTVSLKERRNFTNFKKRSDRQHKNANAKPYLKLNLTTTSPFHPCSEEGKNNVVYATNPAFLSAKK